MSDQDLHQEIEETEENKNKRRRTVRLTGLSGGRGPTKLWAFGYGDLAHLFGVSEGAIRQIVFREQLDPGDLKSIIDYYNERFQNLEKQ